VAISLSPIEELVTKAASYARLTIIGNPTKNNINVKK
jgi:hypothetical protein